MPRSPRLLGIPGALRGLFLALLLGTAAIGCRFERRAEPDEPGASDSLGATISVEDSVRSVVSALDAALEVGDVARVSVLTVEAATLIDQEDAVAWTRSDPSAPLPRALVTRQDSVTWQLESSRFTPVGTGAALIVNQYRGMGGAGTLNAVESLLLVRTSGGWKLQHLHRSHGAVAGL